MIDIFELPHFLFPSQKVCSWWKASLRNCSPVAALPFVTPISWHACSPPAWRSCLQWWWYYRVWQTAGGVCDGKGFQCSLYSSFVALDSPSLRLISGMHRAVLGWIADAGYSWFLPYCDHRWLVCEASIEIRDSGKAWSFRWNRSVGERSKDWVCGRGYLAAPLLPSSRENMEL